MMIRFPVRNECNLDPRSPHHSPPSPAPFAGRFTAHEAKTQTVPLLSGLGAQLLSPLLFLLAFAVSIFSLLLSACSCYSHVFADQPVFASNLFNPWPISRPHQPSAE